MDIFSFIKSKFKNKSGKKHAKSPDYFWPFFTQTGSMQYDSVVIQQAINCIVREMKKLKPRHLRMGKEGLYPVQDRIQAVLDRPNQLMTTTDFIEKIVWNLFFNYNSFVLPEWDEDNRLVNLWPIQPVNVDFLEDPSGEYWVKFQFANDLEGTVRYRDVIHLRYNYSVNQWMGGNMMGQPDLDVLDKTLELNSTMLEGVGKALKSSFAINGVVKYNTMIDEQKAEESIRRLTDALNRNESGLMGLDLRGEFIPFKRDIKLVDPDTLKFLDEKILRHFGVPVCILNGDYTVEQYEAFYQKTLEPLVEELNQAFTKCIFSDRQSSFGNRIQFMPRDLVFMTNGQKVEILRLFVDSGAMFVNEARVIAGLSPNEEYDGVKFMSLNYTQQGANAVDKNGNTKENNPSGDPDKE